MSTVCSSFMIRGKVEHRSIHIRLRVFLAQLEAKQPALTLAVLSYMIFRDEDQSFVSQSAWDDQGCRIWAISCPATRGIRLLVESPPSVPSAPTSRRVNVTSRHAAASPPSLPSWLMFLGTWKSSRTHSGYHHCHCFCLLHHTIFHGARTNTARL